MRFRARVVSLVRRGHPEGRSCHAATTTARGSGARRHPGRMQRAACDPPRSRPPPPPPPLTSSRRRSTAPDLPVLTTAVAGAGAPVSVEAAAVCVLWSWGGEGVPPLVDGMSFTIAHADVQPGHLVGLPRGVHRAARPGHQQPAERWSPPTTPAASQASPGTPARPPRRGRTRSWDAGRAPARQGTASACDDSHGARHGPGCLGRPRPGGPCPAGRASCAGGPGRACRAGTPA